MPKFNLCKVACNLIEIALQDGCCPVSFLHIFRTPLNKTSGGMLLNSKTFQGLYMSQDSMSLCAI